MNLRAPSINATICPLLGQMRFLENILRLSSKMRDTLSSIIISKPNKMAYNSLKMFQPIVLLNTLGKLIKKVISTRCQKCKA